MSEITNRRTGELIRGVFKILLSQPEGMRAKAVLEQLVTVVPPTPFEKADYPNSPGVRRFEKIVRFATIGPVKAGWMVKDKGVWSLTDAGRKAFADLTNPEDFRRESSRLYQQWNAQRPEPENVEVADVEETEETRAETTLEEAEESSWTQIESYLTGMNPYDFQKIVAGLLWGMGYHVAWVAPPGPDGGVDVIAQSDPLGINGPRIKVQVKRSGRMSVGEIRSFLAVVSDGDVGLFVSSGGFTKDAEDLVRSQERRRLMLVDLSKFVDLWIEHYEKVPEEFRRLLPIRPVWFLAPIV